MNRGSCLCGHITWEIEGSPVMMSNCHCSMCRKMHGSAFGTYVGVPGNAFRWTSGEDDIRRYESSPGGLRPFCPNCGSIVASQIRDGDMMFMPAGNLEGDIDKALDSHIFVGSKAPWYEITDYAEQHAGYPEGTSAQAVDNPPRPPATEGAIGGSCLCGAMAFEFDESLGSMGYCHCSRCRKSRSAAHSTQIFVAVDAFRWSKGADQVRDFKLPESEFFITSFCETCGSMMPTIHEERGVVMVPAGALDQDPRVKPQAHIYTGSKANWFEITDGLPQFEAMPPV